MKIFIALFIILLSTIITNTTYEKDKIVSSYAGDKYPVILHGIISNIKPITNSPIPNKNWEVSIHGVWVIKNSVKLNVDEWKLWEDYSFLIQSPAKSFRSIDKITELINKPVEICFYLPTNKSSKYIIDEYNGIKLLENIDNKCGIMDKGLTCCLSLSEKYDGEYYKVKAPSLNLTIKNHSDKVIDLPIGSEKIRILIRGDNNFCTFSQMCVNNINPTTIKLYPDKEIVLFSSLFYGTDKTDKGLELPPGEYRIQGVYDGYLYSNVVDVMVEKL